MPSPSAFAPPSLKLRRASADKKGRGKSLWLKENFFLIVIVGKSGLINPITGKKKHYIKPQGWQSAKANAPLRPPLPLFLNPIKMIRKSR
jgi:hypothetical protein